MLGGEPELERADRIELVPPTEAGEEGELTIDSRRGVGATEAVRRLGASASEHEQGQPVARAGEPRGGQREGLACAAAPGEAGLGRWKTHAGSVERERRAEMPSGQPYLLTRGPLPEPGFVYVMIPQERVAEFRALHESGCFMLPNPWDIGSAVILWKLGFKALASTSAGFAFSRGASDDVGAMSRDGRLAHAWRDGKSVYPGLATDYAAMIKAALALYAATLDVGFVADAVRLAAALRRHHWDPSAPGYFLSADDAEALILRPRSTTDEATPSANSVMAANAIRLWRLTGDDSYRADADAIRTIN